jgi:hypothetical protein
MDPDHPYPEHHHTHGLVYQDAGRQVADRLYRLGVASAYRTCRLQGLTMPKYLRSHGEHTPLRYGGTDNPRTEESGA